MSGVSSEFSIALFAIGAVSAFFLAVGADLIRVVHGPDVGTERVKVGAAGQQSVEHSFDVAPDVQIALLTSVIKSAVRAPAARLPMKSHFFRPTATCFINCSVKEREKVSRTRKGVKEREKVSGTFY